AREHFHAAGFYLFRERLVGAKQQLLASLTSRIKGARHLRAAKRPVCEITRVLASERNSLGHTLVDDIYADFSEAVDVCFARSEVSAFDRVVKQAIDAVAVVLIVLGCVDAALGGDRMRSPGAVLEAKALYLISELREGRGSRTARET